ncbi:hypothetical protein EHS25_002153 [Saitozyma podzolica]|uniref:Uncharacterized protein n=1 Tax=Saitozyma podzolica TaxID=1890683 RepID=A0A427YET7_9TREE|nr:hypothetical protein EHS25_002153 [Saitozyma podzolica]
MDSKHSFLRSAGERWIEADTQEKAQEAMSMIMPPSQVSSFAATLWAMHSRAQCRFDDETGDGIVDLCHSSFNSKKPPGLTEDEHAGNLIYTLLQNEGHEGTDALRLAFLNAEDTVQPMWDRRGIWNASIHLIRNSINSTTLLRLARGSTT